MFRFAARILADVLRVTWFCIRTAWGYVRSNSTPVLAVITMLYVIITWRISCGSDKQTMIIEKTSRIALRAYVYIDVDIPDLDSQRYLMKFPMHGLRGRVKYTIRNEGQTPAHILLRSDEVRSLTVPRFDIRDTFLRFLQGKARVKTDTIPYGAGFIGSGRSYPTGISFGSLSTNDSGNFYVHVYYVYADVFNDYHDVYIIAPCGLDTSQKAVYKFPPGVTMRTFSRKQANAIRSKLNLF